MKPVERLGIVGVGLIGGSLALAARASGIAREIVGLGRSQANLDVALERGLLDRAGRSPETLAGADLVVLATPVSALASSAAAIAPHLARGAVVTDAGSVKGSVVEACTRALAGRARFVGSHPIAGTEGSGAGAAELDLFRGARCVLTPTPQTDPAALALVRELWTAVGMQVVEMTTGDHDAVLALTSHVPHLIAFSLVLAAADRATATSSTELAPLGFAGPSFRGATRVAASSAETWRDILLANRAAVGSALVDWHRRLDELAALVEAGDGDGLAARIEEARAIRRSLGGARGER